MSSSGTSGSPSQWCWPCRRAGGGLVPVLHGALAILLPIPLSLVGILPAHFLFEAFFTATSMIGFIAGAGVIVRNSIILVDFVELKLREGMALEQAVVEAGVVRFRPMLLTAPAVVVGSFVMLFDPIFQGVRHQPDDRRGGGHLSLPARGAGRVLPHRVPGAGRGAVSRKSRPAGCCLRTSTSGSAPAGPRGGSGT